MPLQLGGQRLRRAGTRGERGIEHGQDVDARKGAGQVDGRLVGCGGERPTPQLHDVVLRESELMRPEVRSARARLVRPDRDVGDRVVEYTEAV
ncbi:hypothetical protein BJF90_39735 [Pseudonocardia sp. CNS-004]|nr:hypothetical protein BJF90_39735 [Pseudonocardia sp. CNS-004]